MQKTIAILKFVWYNTICQFMIIFFIRYRIALEKVDKQEVSNPWQNVTFEVFLIELLMFFALI